MHATDPVVEGEIIGYRRWQVTLKKPRAIVTPYVWQPGTNHAECMPLTDKRPCWKSPGLDCACGMNAYYDLAKLNVKTPLIGIVVGSGVVYLHDEAWRAERSRAVAIIDSGWDDWTAIIPPRRETYEYVARYLGVPIIKLDGAQAFASEHGDRVPSELIPVAPRGHSEERG